jgi:hypothetical protein
MKIVMKLARRRMLFSAYASAARIDMERDPFGRKTAYRQLDGESDECNCTSPERPPCFCVEQR